MAAHLTDLFDELFPAEIQADRGSNQKKLTIGNIDAAQTRQVWSVSSLVAELQGIIEESLPDIWLEGEISNFIRATSGHCYFVLKDNRAQLKTVMFKTYASIFMGILKEGSRVLLRGKAGIYAGRGELQFIAEYAEPCGEGALRLAFEALKKKLEAEGLFSKKRKRPLPFFPKKIFLITSKSGAAIHDFLRTADQRNRSCIIVICPSRVQGEGAASELIQALSLCNSIASDGDVVVLTRGGGSIEDLWAFNDESLARQIAASRTPVVSAVGHEVDFTIADYVADLRAATPTQAAMLVLPDQNALLSQVAGLENQLQRQLSHILSRKQNSLLSVRHHLVHPLKKLYDQKQLLDELQLRLNEAVSVSLQKKRQKNTQLTSFLTSRHPVAMTVQLKTSCAALSHRIEMAMRENFLTQKNNFEVAAAKFAALSPLNALARGYSIVTIEETTEVVTDATKLKPDELVNIKPSKGMAKAKIVESSD